MAIVERRDINSVNHKLRIYSSPTLIAPCRLSDLVLKSKMTSLPKWQLLTSLLPQPIDIPLEWQQLHPCLGKYSVGHQKLYCTSDDGYSILRQKI